MKLEIILIIVVIALVKANELSGNNEDTTKFDQYITNATSTEEIKERINFPKNLQKFVVTMKSINERINGTNIKKSLKKPLMIKIIPIVMKIKHSNYWKATTRQPVMKYTKFTVNPFTAGKAINLNRNRLVEKKRIDTDLFNKIMDAPKKDDSSEEISESPVVKNNYNNREQTKKIISSFHKVQNKKGSSKIHNTKNALKSNDTINRSYKNVTIGKKAISDFSSEEREDKQEFIFVKPKKTENRKKVNDDSDESEETTTGVAEEVIKGRQTRSINIIEEENLGTTVSGFKFTGKIASLSNNLIFRNINA